MKTNFTKTILPGLIFFFICSHTSAQSPPGLENIIVEKYYVSDEADSNASVGILPVGSVTYRIFVDMKQGYKFQAAYGNTDPFGVPAHTLFFNTTTSFFNNEDRGGVTPTFTKSQAKNNTIMLDSWLSSGAACAGNFGIPKADDNGVATVVNGDGVLQNADAMAGIPLTEQDGLLLGTPGSFTIVGPQAESQIAVFDALSQAGNSFVLTDGAWSCLAGAVGADTTNKVLIAQITTDGIFSFELNIQLGTPSGIAQQYVARNAIDLEILFPGCTYTSDNVGLLEPIEKPLYGNLDQVTVFPNPTNGNFSVSIKSENTNSIAQCTIYDLVGKVVLKKYIDKATGNFTHKFDLSAYPNGMYFIEVSVDGKKSTSKLIKK